MNNHEDYFSAAGHSVSKESIVAVDPNKILKRMATLEKASKRRLSDKTRNFSEHTGSSDQSLKGNS